MGPGPPAIEQFAAGYPFLLDDYQRHACGALAEGRSVLVAAPTGAGKTVVGEFAVHLARAAGRTAFYTTPIKALSNQKYADFVERYGSAEVGLLTGDVTRNPDASVVVMTTEVLRNMLYAGSRSLARLGAVVLDEVHYLGDRERGPVWEEVIITLAPSVPVAALSATVSNAEEVGRWLDVVHGSTEVVVAETRPVPLRQHVLAGSTMHDLLVGPGRVNPELVRLASEAGAADRQGHRRPGAGRRRPRTGSRHLIPSRTRVVQRLESAGLLPAIVFVFSRKGCDDAVDQLVSAGTWLTQPHERAEIRAVVAQRCAELPEEDLAVVGFHRWRDALERGVAAHHAGALPMFKETVEELFTRGLVRVVYATETLALGINMPARSVVLERLRKFNGQEHADLSAGEYTQLTGRGGRRGIDEEGHAVVLWQPGIDPVALAGLATTRTYPLRSAFRPTYSMAVNLVDRQGMARARDTIASSLAQFQTNRRLAERIRGERRLQTRIEQVRTEMTCELGDVEEYRRLLSERDRVAAAPPERRGGMSTVLAQLAALRPGDVVVLPGARRRTLAVVIAAGRGQGEETGPVTVLTERERVRALEPADLVLAMGRDAQAAGVPTVGRVDLARAGDVRRPHVRRGLIEQMRTLWPPEETGRVAEDRADGAAPPRARRPSRSTRRSVAAHPVHRCPERDAHLTALDQLDRLLREHARLQRELSRTTDNLKVQFDALCVVLAELGYLESGRVTDAGRRLRTLHGEQDLMAAEAIGSGRWEGLSPAELAACAAALTFVSRGPDEAPSPHLPPGRARDVLAWMEERAAALRHLEMLAGVPPARDLDLTFTLPTWRWATGHRLEAVLLEAEMGAGDFVRASRRVIDLLDQVAATSPPLAPAARKAVNSLRRGVVGYVGYGLEDA